MDRQSYTKKQKALAMHLMNSWGQLCMGLEGNSCLALHMMRRSRDEHLELGVPMPR